jgi:hypothetical protein
VAKEFTQTTWREAGHQWQREGICRSCNAKVEWWLMRGGRINPMNPMPTADSPAVSHFATCPQAAAHRSNKKVN